MPHEFKVIVGNTELNRLGSTLICMLLRITAAATSTIFEIYHHTSPLAPRKMVKANWKYSHISHHILSIFQRRIRMTRHSLKQLGFFSERLLGIKGCVNEKSYIPTVISRDEKDIQKVIWHYMYIKYLTKSEDWIRRVKRCQKPTFLLSFCWFFSLLKHSVEIKKNFSNLF